MITIVLWKWRQRPVFRESYRPEYVNEAARMISGGLSIPHRVVCVTDNPAGVHCQTYPIWSTHAGVANISGAHLPSCYRRLRLFEMDTLASLGVERGQRVASVDVDLIVTGLLDPLFQRSEPFVGWMVRGGRRTTVLNGSMFMFTAGEYESVWHTFDPRRSPLRAHNAGFMGSDQGWMSYCLVDRPEVGGWNRADGVLSFTRDVVRDRRQPDSGRVVFFAGSRKPWHPELRDSAPWTRQYADYSRERAYG